MSLDLDLARERFESSTDFTIGLEEEFAILDPATLELEHRFEELYAACREGRRAGRLGGRRADRLGDRDPLGPLDRPSTRRWPPSTSAAPGSSSWPTGWAWGWRAMGTHPWADYLDQRIIDTPHYNRLRRELGWVAQRNNTWSMHVHMGVRGADRAIAVCDWMRELLPLLLAASANSPFLDRRDTGLHTVRTEIFTRTFPRCGVPSPFVDWDSYAEFVGMLQRTGSVVESTQLWWSVRPHHKFGTVEVRICDAQTRGDESFGLAAPDRRLHRPDGARLRRARLRRRRRAAARPRDRGEPLAGDPPRDERQADRLPPRRGDRGAGGAGRPARVDRAGALGARDRAAACRSATALSGRARRSTPVSRSRTSTATRCARRTAPTRGQTGSVRRAGCGTQPPRPL